MTVGSLFSGIGGFDLAAERAGLRVAWQIERDPFCRRVLARHWPGMERHGDIRTVDPARLGAVDLLCGGWPCQGNSVAGKRRGHADERSGLFSEILRFLDGMDPRPRFLLLENVPGLVSVNGGRDFAAVVGELRRRGYVGCVRRLDAQHFGLAQRRKRLFFVCGVGAAGLRAVQSVLEGGARHPAPRRAEGEVPAGELGEVAFSESGPGWWRDGVGVLRVRAERTHHPSHVVARALTSHPDRQDASVDTYVMGTDNTKANGSYLWRDQSPTLEAGRHLPAVAACPSASYGKQPDCSDRNGGPPNLVFNWQSGGDVRHAFGDLPSALQAEQTPAVLRASVLRRLTPTEFERLQGFPDGHTCLCGRNAGGSAGEDPCVCPDGPRYRALGNAVAVPVVEWLFRRIAEAHA